MIKYISKNKEIKLLKEKPKVIAKKIIEFDQNFKEVIGFSKNMISRTNKPT